MSKYIIDIPNGVEWGVVTCRTEDGFYTRDFDSLEELNSDYINEHYGELQDTAYQRGLNDAWECARKIVCDDTCGGMSMKELVEIFNKSSDAYIIRDFTAQQAIEMLKAHEQKKDDKIGVGDEVEWTGDKYIVTYINYDIDTSEITDYDLLGDDGSVVDHVKKCVFTKTGRHFDIQSILEAMKHD